MAKTQQKMSKVEEEEEDAPLYGDVLDTVLSKMHLIHLLPASKVSTSWNAAVSSSIRLSNRTIKPWLIVHTQSNRFPYLTAARAYDPDSRVWLDILPNPPLKYISTLRSSHSTLLYMLSPSKFAFSADPFHLTWHRAESAPLIWRTDPIIALVGHRVVVAGGACDYEDDPLSVEMYDVRHRTWETCNSMPAILKDSAASTWLSVAADESRMYVTEKCSSVMYSFDPESKTWFGPYDLRPDQTVFSSLIGTVNGGRMILAGVVGEAGDVKGVKLWEVGVGNVDEALELREMIGEMPEKMVEKMKGESDCTPSISMSCMGDVVWLHNASDPSELIVCEVRSGGCRWSSVRNAVLDDGTRLKRLVLTCANVGLPDLHRAVQVGALKIP